MSDEERELETDEDTLTVSSILYNSVVPDSKVTSREGEECARRALEEVAASVASHADYRAKEASVEESFVDIMGTLVRETGSESEGSTFADILQSTDILSEILLDGGVDALVLPFCESSFFIPLDFVCINHMKAIHNFNRLVFSARLYMKMASRSCCVSVFGSSRKPAGRPEESMRDVLCSFGTKFVVGRATSDEKVFGTSTSAPMEILSSL